MDHLPDFLIGASEVTQDLWLVANQNDSHALARAANALFPPPQFQPNRWSDHRATHLLRTGPNKEMTAWFGPGASAKTFDAAKLAFTYWLAAPDRTTVTCCSTTAKMLDQRIWGAIKKLYHALMTNPDYSELPIKLYEGDTRQVVYVGESEKGRNPNAMLRGVAIEQGSVDDAINNVIGVHNERMLLIVDEAQGSREALIEARINLRKGTKDFRILLIGNPTSRNDPLGRYAEPNHEKGYDSIPIIRRPFQFTDGSVVMLPSPAVRDWESRERQNGALGHVYLYNGLDSPSLDSPEEGERLNFLIHQANIEQDIREYGPDHPRMWTFTIGFIPPFQSSGTMFSEHSFAVRCPFDPPVWRYEPVHCLSIDPSFTRGGDHFIITPFDVGNTPAGATRIHFHPHIRVPIGIPAPGQLQEEMVCDKIRDIANTYAVDPSNIVFDASGNQRTYVGILERTLKCQPGTVLSLVTNTKSSALPMNANGDVAELFVGNARAEAYFLWWHLLERGHLTGISDTARLQACATTVVKDEKKSTASTSGRVYIEAKGKIKSQLNGQSPDEADTVANACYLARHRLGVIAGLDVEIHEGLDRTQNNLVDTPPVVAVPRRATYGVSTQP
jgi:hypothetical protein